MLQSAGGNSSQGNQESSTPFAAFGSGKPSSSAALSSLEPHSSSSASPASSLSSLTNLACATTGAKVLFATDEWFAPAFNLLSPHPPIWRDGLFTPFGKWMDGWETRRRRTTGYDYCIIQLGRMGVIRGLEVNTKYFTGNYAPSVTVQAAYAPDLEEQMRKYLESPPENSGGNSSLSKAKRPEAPYSVVGCSGLEQKMSESRDGADQVTEGEEEEEEPSLSHCRRMTEEMQSKLGVTGTGVSVECRRWFEWLVEKHCRIKWVNLLVQEEMGSGREDTCSNMFEIETAGVAFRQATNTALSPGRKAEDIITHSSSRPVYTHIKLNILPDGGVARFRLYGEIHVLESPSLTFVHTTQCGRRLPAVTYGTASSALQTGVDTSGKIGDSQTGTPGDGPPHPALCLPTAAYSTSSPVVECNEFGEVNLAAALNGAVCLCWSDCHYGHPRNLLLREAGSDMGSGWETARSPDRPLILIEDPVTKQISNFPPHVLDWVLIRLGARGLVKRIELDTEHFKGNFPESCELDGCDFCLVDQAEEAQDRDDIFWQQHVFTEDCRKEMESRRKRWKTEEALDKEASRKRRRVPDDPPIDGEKRIQWFPLAERFQLQGDCVHIVEVEHRSNMCTHVRLRIYPDGGVMRLRVWGQLPNMPGWLMGHGELSRDGRTVKYAG